MDHTHTITVQCPAQDFSQGQSGASQLDPCFSKQISPKHNNDTEIYFVPAITSSTRHSSRRYSLSSSSGSDTSDQSEAFSQASDSTAITEPDFRADDDQSVFARSPSEISFSQSSGIYTFGSTRHADVHAAAKAAVESKLAALDRSGEQRIAALRSRQQFAFQASGSQSWACETASAAGRAQSQSSNGSRASVVPIGRHRCALSSVDSILQTRSQRFPVLRRSAAARPVESSLTNDHHEAGPKDTALHPRRSAPANSWSAPAVRKASLVGPSSGPAGADAHLTLDAASARRSTLSQSWSPPSLVREEDRRKVMVEQLVGMHGSVRGYSSYLLTMQQETASQLISAIWPGSVSVPEASQGIVISLPFFVRETLRRSRTSYNSLQVALYYIVKLRAKGHLPVGSAGCDKNNASHGFRAMRCGRRMLLTSLILASKYLQDRNFSARAWSKISGLPVDEITGNEMAVLKALDWKLHVTESDFAHWSTVVHKSTEVLKETGDCKSLWQQVIKLHREGASIEALALAMRPAQQMREASLRRFPEASLPSPTSSVVDFFRTVDDSRGQMSGPSSISHGMLATPASSPQRDLGACSMGLPPSAPRLGANLSTPSFTPPNSLQTSTPAVLTGARQKGGDMKITGRNSGWTEVWMPSPVSLTYSSDEESELHPVSMSLSQPAAAGIKRRAGLADTDELMAGASPPKVLRRD